MLLVGRGFTPATLSVADYGGSKPPPYGLACCRVVDRGLRAHTVRPYKKCVAALFIADCGLSKAPAPTDLYVAALFVADDGTSRAPSPTGLCVHFCLLLGEKAFVHRFVSNLFKQPPFLPLQTRAAAAP